VDDVAGAVLVGLIAALGALCGAALGPLLTARQAHRQWLRDRRAEAYAAYLTTLNAHLQTAEQWVAYKSDPGQWEEWELTDRFQQFDHASIVVELFGSHEAQALDRLLAFALHDHFTAGTQYNDANRLDTLKTVRGEAARIRAQFRSDLGVRAGGYSSFWRLSSWWRGSP
jgi:hypothetical protein